MVDDWGFREFDTAEDKDLALVGQDAHVAYIVVLSRQSMSMGQRPCNLTATTHVRRKGFLASTAERGEHTDSGQLLEDDSFMVFHDRHGGDTFDDGQVDRSEL